MRQLWRSLSPEGRLPGGSAPDGETLAAYSAALCDLLMGVA